MGKYFGTDGFRGEANVTLTVDHAFKVGRFLGWYYGKNHENGKAKIVIGKDTRRSSYMFEYSLVAGLTASGADAYLLHVTTTPSVSDVARTEDFDCGIMISASHNPYYDNGIKLAVVTSKTKKTALRGLKLFGLESYFSTVIGINECINPKPHPEPVNIALQELKLAPEVCLMVGDSPADIMSGKQAGVKTVAVKWTHLDWLKLQEHEPDYVLQKMSDILKIS